MLQIPYTVGSHLSELQLSEQVGYPNGFKKPHPLFPATFVDAKPFKWPISSVSGLALPVV